MNGSRGRFIALVKRSTDLHQVGRGRWRGFCPFEKNPREIFYVFEERSTWRCFGACNEGGDIFSFVQKRDGVSFKKALSVVAAEAGVEPSPPSTFARFIRFLSGLWRS